MRILALTLWCLVPVPLALTAWSQSVGDAVKVVDIAREKDVVWLALATACVAVSFSAWLVYRKDRQGDASTLALIEVAKSMGAVANEFKELRSDLQDRPCFERFHDSRPETRK
jgi:hypothetical protein